MPMFEIAYSKPSKRFVVKSVKEKKITNTWNTFCKIIKRVNVGKSHQEGMRRKGSYLCELSQESDEIIDRSQKYQIINIKRIKL